MVRSVLGFICGGSLLFFSLVNADTWDPVDDAATGATVLVTTAYEQTQDGHTVGISDSNDFFRVSMQSGYLYYFESLGDSDMYGELYSDSSLTNLVDFSDTGGEGNNFRIEYTAPISGDYYLKVRTLNIGLVVDYAIRYQELSVTDAWDPDDDLSAHASELLIDTSLHQTLPHVLRDSDTEDWFRFTMTSGIEYRVQSTGSWDPYGTIFSDSNATVVVAEDDDGDYSDFNFSIAYTPTNTGEYYLQVINAGFYSAASYTLEYQRGDPADGDGDGMPDAWEVAYLNGTDAMPDDLSRDEDSFSNLDEYIAGTDPTNSASFFAITNWLLGSFIIEWPSVSNRVYQVYRADSLTNTFNAIGPLTAYPQNSYTDAVLSAGAFYKVEVQLQ